MKSKSEIQALLTQPYRVIEKTIGIEIRNGQAIKGIRTALNWVLEAK